MRFGLYCGIVANATGYGGAFLSNGQHFWNMR